MNECDDRNDLPLDLALRSKQESIANYLIKSNIDINKTDNNGLSLLHKAILRGDEYSAMFLIDNKISVNLLSYMDKKTALMYLTSASEPTDAILAVVNKILQSPNIDVNIQDVDGNTALHIAIITKNKTVFKEILFNMSSMPNLTIKNKLEQTVLWLALMQSEKNSKI